MILDTRDDYSDLGCTLDECLEVIIWNMSCQDDKRVSERSHVGSSMSILCNMMLLKRRNHSHNLVLKIWLDRNQCMRKDRVLCEKSRAYTERTTRTMIVYLMMFRQVYIKRCMVKITNVVISCKLTCVKKVCKLIGTMAMTAILHLCLSVVKLSRDQYREFRTVARNKSSNEWLW